MFRDRKKEMGMLEELRKESSAKLIIIYGRRRVGKTELLNEFCRRHKALYLLARREPEREQLKKFSEEISEFFNDEVLKLNPFVNYDALFAYLAQKDTPLLFDEFPYLIEGNKGLPSILQEYWDKAFSRKNAFIILCGSSIAMMVSLMGHKSPLYGRRTNQLLLEPLEFREAREFFPNLSPEEQVKAYAILGGTPAYLLAFDYKKPLIANIKENALNKTRFLYNDTMFVIQQELNEPSTYYAIIKSIAKGNTKMGNIANDTGIEKGKISKYLAVLKSLQLIERTVPITEKNKEKSRKGIYLLKDNYFKFWFRFVFGNDDYIEQERQDKLLAEKIIPELAAFVGKAYESIALKWAAGQSRFKNYLFGRWWDKGEEIDIVGIDKQENSILLGEVKWKPLAKKEALGILAALKEKAERIKWGNAPKKRFMLIAKKINGKGELAKEGHIAVELGDIVKGNE